MIEITHTKGNRSPSLTDTITVDGAAFDLTGSTVKFKMRSEDSGTLKVDAAATIVTPPGVDGQVRYDWAALDVDTAGDFLAWWEVTLPSGKTQDTPEFEITFVDHVPGEPGLSTRALVDIRESRLHAFRDENDDSRDDILVAAVNTVSASIEGHCEREFVDTTTPDRSGTDGVTDGTTTFVAATGSFTAADIGSRINIDTKGFFTIVSVTDPTTVELDGSPSAGSDLSWDFGEERSFALRCALVDGIAVGWINLVPYDLRTISVVTLYSDRDSADQRVLESGEYTLRPIGGAPGGTFLNLRTIAPTLSEQQPGFGWQVSVKGWWGMAAVPEDVKFACLEWMKNLVTNPGSFASAELGGFAVTPDIDFATTGRGMPRAVMHRLSRYRRSM